MMDIGGNKYDRGTRSRLAVTGKQGITDSLMENKFSIVASFDGFNDSLANIAGSITRLKGNFNIYQPCRLMINVDQHMVHNFFINAGLTIPVLPIVANNTLFIKDINLLALTPRWELKSVGAYLPILFNTKNQLWVGGAFKAGPVLMGTHNLANLFAKNKIQTGGFYIALTIRPEKIYDKKGHDPIDKLTGKQRKGLGCPRF